MYLADNREKAEIIINRIGHKDFIMQELIRTVGVRISG